MPVRQPYARVDFIPQSGTKNLATGVKYMFLPHERSKKRTEVLYFTTEAETFVTSTSEHVLPQPIPICRLLIVKLDNLSDLVSCAYMVLYFKCRHTLYSMYSTFT